MEIEIDELTRERNLFKGKNASLLALLSKMRDRLAVITTEIEDEGDRAYFGSTNDADELKEFESDMMDWLIDAEVPHLTMTEDPYASIRELRARAEAAEAALSTESSRREAMKKALEPFAAGSLDVSGTAVILGYPSARPAWEAARAALLSTPNPGDADGWRAIDSAPISNGSTRFLAHIIGHGCAVCYAGAGRFIYSVSTGRRINAATHWRPLPAPPASSLREGEGN